MTADAPAVAPNTSTLAHALAHVQATLPPIHKGKTATVTAKEGRASYSYAYADLADVAAAIMPRLGAAGLLFTTRPTVVDGGRFALVYELRHVAGDSITGEYPLPHPDRTKPQDLGSAITYARRYVLCCVTGVVPDEDDDGQLANANVAAGSSAPAPRPDQLAQDAANRLASFDGPLETLDAVHRYARDNGYADERVAVPWEPLIRPTLTEALRARGEQLIAARKAAEVAAQDAAAGPPAETGQTGEDPPADPAPSAAEAALSTPATPPPAAADPPAPSAPQSAARQSTTESPTDGDYATLGAVVEQAAETADLDLVSALFRDNRALAARDVTELLDEADVGILHLRQPVQLGAFLMAVRKRLAAGEGPLAGPPVGGPEYDGGPLGDPNGDQWQTPPDPRDPDTLPGA